MPGNMDKPKWPQNYFTYDVIHKKSATHNQKIFFGCRLEQCLSTGCIVHPRVYQDFPGVFQPDGVCRGVPDVCFARKITLSHTCPLLQRSVLTFHRF